MAAASKHSGHMLDFHSSSLLRNAVTYLKWQIPMAAVQSVFRAAGVDLGGKPATDDQCVAALAWVTLHVEMGKSFEEATA